MVGCPEWIEEIVEASTEAREKLRERIEAALLRIVDSECYDGPSLDLVKGWHKVLFYDLVPLDYYAGNFRDDDPGQPCLQIYEVEVGGVPGAPCMDVLSRVDKFTEVFRDRLADLDSQWKAGLPDVAEVMEVISLAAWSHGEWIRIHPFANGNGRTARLWANYVFCRYGFGPVVTVRPRPDQPYGIAARASMLGDHTKMEDVFLNLLLENYETA